MTTPLDLPVAASGASALDVAWRCARAAGEHALSRFRGAQTIDIKGNRNIVTATDVEAELLVKDLLAGEFPSHAILSEETASGTDARRGWVWVVDPIDGTKNYACGIPFWCTNVALCLDGEPVVGLTYDAVHAEGFWAASGAGAFCNDRPIAVSAKPDVAAAVIGIDLGYDDAMGARQLDLMRRIFPNVQGIRITGSAALGMAYAACGRIDLYTHMNVSPWDVAAGILLVREAGGAASDRSGGPMRVTSATFAAGGRRVHDDFMARYAAAQGGGVPGG
ncbi:MAG TPA: inositol monophosphatase family protein [Dehalococcoidia bacterium]|nr:inositol monophosphatase family protein [Dehalococcoidia bacterium]